jgi:serine/threonine protein kinase
MESRLHNKFVKTINKNYQLFIDRKLGCGAFGEVYQGYDIKKNKYIAIKIENLINNNNPQLKHEASVIKYLEGGEGIPKMFFFQESLNHCFMGMELLGINLECLLNRFNRHISLKNLIFLGTQMLKRIEYLHTCHIIHRDIKPENFVIGGLKQTENILYLCDFGLAKRFRNPKTGDHIPYIDGKKLTGTARYASLYTHLGIEQSRRDDIEGIMYTLIYLYKGSLPWQNVKCKCRNEKYNKIFEKKINTDVEVLCENMPKQFETLVTYARGLLFEEKPDYEYMRNLLNSINLKDVTKENVNDIDLNENNSTNSSNHQNNHSISDEE